MNYEAVRQGNGNLVAMLARVGEIGVSKLSQSNKPYQSVKLIDDTNESHSVTIHQGSGSLLDINALNQRLAFNVQTYQGSRGTAYSGYWNNKSQVRQTVPQNSPQSPQQPQQAPQQPRQGKNGNDVVRIRSMALAYAKDLVVGDKIPPVGLQSCANEFTGYIMTGRWLNKPQQINNPPQEWDTFVQENSQHDAQIEAQQQAESEPLY